MYSSKPSSTIYFFPSFSLFLFLFCASFFFYLNLQWLAFSGMVSRLSISRAIFGHFNHAEISSQKDKNTANKSSQNSTNNFFSP